MHVKAVLRGIQFLSLLICYSILSIILKMFIKIRISEFALEIEKSYLLLKQLPSIIFIVTIVSIIQILGLLGRICALFSPVSPDSIFHLTITYGSIIGFSIMLYLVVTAVN